MVDYSIIQLAEMLGAELPANQTFAEKRITGIGTLKNANSSQLSFFTNTKYKTELSQTDAGVVLLSESHLSLMPDRGLVVENPHVAFAKMAQLFDTTPKVAESVSPSAVIDPSATLAKGVCVGPNAVIGAHVVLEENVQVGAGAVIGQQSTIGANSIIHPNVTLYHDVHLGKNVVVHSNTVIGSDGFGYANDKGQWLPIPQTGRVIVGDETQIGSSCSIDRGALEDTVIGYNVIIDNQVHIAHNVEIGDHSCICGATGIAGSTTLGKYVVVGGCCGINGHITITDKVQITAYSMVVGDITEPGVYSSGQPALPNREWRKNTIRARQLDDLFARVKHLENSQKD